MPSAGKRHTVLLRSDGTAFACGDNTQGECDIPALSEGVTYVQVVAGAGFTVLLRSDGTAVACGMNNMTYEFPRPTGSSAGLAVTYTHIAVAAVPRICYLRSDGVVGLLGHSEISGGWSPKAHPPLSEGMTYKQVAAGGIHAAALRSDGTVHVFGVLEMPGTRGAMLLRHCDVPMLEAGVTYEQVSLGDTHTVYLRSDGIAVATGFPRSCSDIPPLSEGATYTQVSAGSSHTVLLRSDGTVVCCGENGVGQCDVPAPEEGVTYTQVSAGASFTVLLRSDGEAIAFGANDLGQCDVARRPRGDDALEAMTPSRRGVTIVPNRLVAADFVVQLSVEGDAVIGLSASCHGMGGELLASLPVLELDGVVTWSVAKVLQLGARTLRLVLPDGSLVGPDVLWEELVPDLGT